MTAREMLRAAAERIDCGVGTVDEDGCDMKPPCDEFAAALRALAERIDAELAASAPDYVKHPQQTRDRVVAAALLARLDAPLPPGTGTQEPR